ncbi:spermidine synthase [Amycolatopsis alkalitolerans]|uniref:Spermidine synthase-like protein n=1 Tax=Amycolatopsis alkalitolerans TaxID=2547244 RepID=A0A5C4M6M2_9PSEU|nr:fused MFS/spermidine synthase [Amycolatopsis alkalitolerans]TNC27295.1 spermidine synthase-like protein [Amycolatopsis alkalitolerans]
MPGEYPVRFGTAELLADADHPGGWLLSVDGIAQSYVDIDDPEHLEFEYVRRMGDVIDCLGDGREPLEALHLGGAGCTLPRYVAATRPGSRQLVFDADGPLIELVREQLDLRSVPRLRVRISDGRAGVATRHDDTADLVIVDVFRQASMPSDIATLEFTRDVARVLRPPGAYLLNVADGPGLIFTRRVTATVASVFGEVLLLAEPGVLRGRRFGNVVLAASGTELPVQAIAGRAASAAFPARCVAGDDLKSFYGKAKPLTDADGMAAPMPPPKILRRGASP